MDMHGYTGATHMTMVFVKRTILFSQCATSKGLLDARL